MIQIRISSGGLEHIIARLKAKDKKVLQKQIQQAIISDIRDNSEHARSYSGKNFKPLTPRYRKWKTKHGGKDIPDLYMTDMLMKSLFGETEGIMTRISSKDKEGKVEGVQKLRPFIGISEKARKTIKEIARKWVGL